MKTEQKLDTKNGSAWIKFFYGIGVILLLFVIAIQATNITPFFLIHTMTLEKNIDTTALFYKDIEEFSVSEQWITNCLNRD